MSNYFRNLKENKKILSLYQSLLNVGRVWVGGWMGAWYSHLQVPSHGWPNKKKRKYLCMHYTYAVMTVNDHWMK